ncbi:MAG: NADH-quinone oxidoreductase subunit C [Bacteroidetes bacterium]|nr:NADH-quinone oxidoreductase subunit C [Bacteroidota bacterium]
MTKEELKNNITELLPSTTFDETGEFLNVIIASDELLPFMKTLRSKSEFDFDYLFCLTCIDLNNHLMMVYHLISKTHNHCIVIKAKITDTIKPEIESVNSIWKTAELNEDEVYDLFGVKFLNHPNLRRLFLEEDWEGYPLRKNYVDENMIKL